MLKKQSIVCLLVVFFFFSFVGSAVAENGDKTILGTDEFSFETYEDKSISGYVYDQERLGLVGTEGGNWEHNPNAKETKADRATRDYNYDESQLSKVGTEGGDWEFRFDSPENAVCGSC